VGENVISTLEPDSHADLTCAGQACRVLEYTNMTCNVRAFSNVHQELSNIPIVKAATASNAPNGITYILILNRRLHGTIPPMPKSSKKQWGQH
jgi:hypothetical protein